MNSTSEPALGDAPTSRPVHLPGPIKSKIKRLLPIIGLVLILPVIAGAVKLQQRLSSQAASPGPAKVLISPMLIPRGGASAGTFGLAIDPGYSQTIYMSAQAVDEQGSPIQSGVTYVWGFSSTGSIGNFVPDSNQPIASFTPSKTNYGLGDIWIRAVNSYGTATSSIKVCVGVPCPTQPTPTPSRCYYEPIVCIQAPCPTPKLICPTPIPTPTSNPKLTCAQTGGTWREFPDSCADTCSPGQPRACLTVVTPSCDCGPNACWSGTACIPNPPTPTLTPTPTPMPPPPSSPPIIITSSLPHGRVKRNYSATIQSFDPDTPAQLLTFSAVNLPPGLSQAGCQVKRKFFIFGPSLLQCHIRGKPTQSGTWPVLFTLSDESSSASKTLPLVIR